jgi:phenylpyruvate tautomerase PptA (4-oxalocrotonate tautomerase family)
MPFARISVQAGKDQEYLATLADTIHESLVEAFEVPPADRFQAVHQHAPGELIFDEHYMGGPRSGNYVLICITAGRLRTTRVKQQFYKHLVQKLGVSPGVRPEDVMVVINTTFADEWSFGFGKSIVPDETEQG